MVFKPDFTKENPYEGVPPEYIEQIRGTGAYESAVKAGFITPESQSTPTTVEQEQPESATIAASQTPTTFKPDFTKENPYEGVPAEYIEKIKGTGAYESAVRAGFIEPETQPPLSAPTTIKQEQQREQELREAIVFSEKVKSGEAQLPMDEDIGAYWRSVEDTQRKFDILQQAKAVEKSYTEAGLAIPGDIQNRIDIAKATVFGTVSSFIDTTTGQVNVSAALKSGVSSEELAKIGVPSQVLQAAKSQELLKTKYGGNLRKAIEGGDISAVRDVIGGESTLASQIAVADIRQAEQELKNYVDQPTGSLDLTAAVAAGIPFQAIKTAGYSVTDDEYRNAQLNVLAEESQKLLGDYRTDDGKYRIADYLSDHYNSTLPYDGANKENLNKALDTLKGAGFTDDQIDEARQQAFVSPTSAISPVGEEVRPMPVGARIAETLTEWNRQLQDDVQKSIEEQTGLGRIGISTAAGVLQAGTTLITAPFILGGKIIANPVGAPVVVWDVAKGAASHVVNTGKNLVTNKYGADIAIKGDMSPLVYDTIMSYLIVEGAGRLGKGAINRVITYVAPRGVPPAAIIKEASTGRIPVTETEMAKQFADAMNKVEQLSMQRGGKLVGEVPIEGTPYKLRYVKTPLEQVVGDVLFHGTKDEYGNLGTILKESALKIAEREGKVVAGESGLYTDPWAAIGYSRGGENPALLMIITDSSKIKTGAEGLAEGLTLSDAFVREASPGFYGSSKVWRGDLETEIVGSPGTTVEVPTPQSDLLTRVLVGDYADLFTRDEGKYIPIKIGIDTVNVKPEVVELLRQPSTWYGIKLYSLYSGLRTAAEAMRHPGLVLKDVSGVLKEMANLDRFIREGTGGKGVAFPGVRDVYLVEGLGARLRGVWDSLLQRAMKKTRDEVGTVAREDGKYFRDALERNLQDVYRQSADTIIKAYSDVSQGYAASEEIRQKFEDAYLANLGVASEAAVKSAELNKRIRELTGRNASSSPITGDIIQSVNQYAETVSRLRDERGLEPISRQVVSEPSVVAEEVSLISTPTLAEPKREPIFTPVEPTSLIPTEPAILGEPILFVPSETESLLLPSELLVPTLTPPVVLKGKKYGREEEVNILPGTFVWIQGRPLGKGGEENVPMFKLLPPPYRQEDFFTMRETPPGYVDEGWTGKGMTKKSLQVVGGLPENNVENIDLGWARVNLNIVGGKPEIEYVHDEDANVGERSKTVGMGRGQIPVDAWNEAKAEGKTYEEFIREYSGALVGGRITEPVANQPFEIPVASKTVAEEEPVEEEPEVQEVPEELPARAAVKSRINEITTLDESKLPQEVFGSEIEVEEPDSGYTVVPSYIRRKKPAKDWWESDYYENPTAPVRRAGELAVSERTYLGHRLLPPDLGGAI